MKYNESDLKEGIKLHIIKTDKFKTNLIAVMLTTKLERENITKNALIPAVLRRGTTNLNTQEEINKKLENMYGAGLDCGIDKTGDNQVLKFYIESINDEFLPQDNENMLKISYETIFEMIFSPYLENNCFKKEYVEQEKENLKQIIQARIDNKAKYAIDRCIEEMYKDEPYGLYKFGYVEDLEDINEKNLYEYYLQLINNCKIDIFVSGILDENIVEDIKNNENISKMQKRNPAFIVPEIKAKKSEQENLIQDKLDVTQGKLILGLDIDVDDENLRYDTMIYNSILGGSANSKLFQNVREKASLAYTASSSYIRFKNNIIINCGIEIENYEKALKIIKEQVEAIKNGDFTDEEVENAKQGIIAAVKTIDDEQDTEITYFYSQEFSHIKNNIDEYIDKVRKVNKENVLNIANKISINTIYFLRGI